MDRELQLYSSVLDAPLRSPGLVDLYESTYDTVTYMHSLVEQAWEVIMAARVRGFPDAGYGPHNPPHWGREPWE